MKSITHPDILNAERFGSRYEECIYVCAGCGRTIKENAEIDIFGRTFCCEKCNDKFYGKTLEV